MCFVRGSAFSGAWKNNFVVFRLSCGAERETLKLFSLWFPSCTFNSHFSLFGKEFHKASKSSRQDGRRCGGAKLYGENYRKLLRPISMTVVWRRKKSYFIPYFTHPLSSSSIGEILRCENEKVSSLCDLTVALLSIRVVTMSTAGRQYIESQKPKQKVQIFDEHTTRQVRLQYFSSVAICTS